MERKSTKEKGRDWKYTLSELEEKIEAYFKKCEKTLRAYTFKQGGSSYGTKANNTSHRNISSLFKC